MQVVINRAGLGDQGVEEYCRQQGLPIAAQIPYERQVAEMYSQGQVLAEASERHAAIFQELAQHITGGGPCLRSSS